MIFQAILLAALALMVLYAFSQRSRSGPLAYAIIGAALAGAMLVMFPGFSTELANALGVGRGADLVFYAFMLIMFAAVANMHLRMRAHAETMTSLARSIALLTAQRPQPGQGQ